MNLRIEVFYRLFTYARARISWLSTKGDSRKGRAKDRSSC
jgi:hypothetical protein